ncbi:MAG TPA: sulfatase [Kofleriaceae bacterium]|nr:sulfatase [Kofleriaceae bacterium]
MRYAPGVVASALALAAAGCGGQAPPHDTDTTPPVKTDGVLAPGGAPAAPAATGASAPAPPPIALAATPRIDLTANRPRWHVYDGGLVIPIAGAGLAKYELALKTAWTAPATIDGRAARTLRGPATLAFPWLALDGDGAAEIVVTARGPAKLTVALDGKKLGVATVAAGWGEARVAVPAGALTAGEHALTVDGKRAAIAAIAVVPAGGGAATACEPERWRRVSLYLELPATAHLAARPIGAERVRVRVTDEGGDARVVYDGAAAALPPALALPDTGDRVVRLDLEGDGACAGWDGAQVAVRDAPARPRPAPVDNVVLVVIDTLRADRLRAYADTRVETPWLTEAAARGAVFLHNQSIAPSSPPSHATIHSGQIPRVHGALGDDGELAKGTPLLAAVLGKAGFATGYVGNNDFAMGRLRAAAGWHVAETPYYRHGKDCAPIIDRAVAIARDATAAGKRWFVTALPIEPHVAYRFHPGITDRYFAGPWAPPLGKKALSKHLGRMKTLALDARDWDQLRALYDGEVTRVDQCLRALEDGLRAAGALERTAIVITSDHGEGLGERRGAAGHAYSLNRELVDVPLIVIGGVPPARIAAASSNADIAPTVLDLLGLPADPRMQGRSLVADAVLPVALPRVVASEYGKAYALRATRWHLVVGYDGRGALYDLVDDPREVRDRAGDAAIPLRYLRDAAGLYLAHRAAWHAATWGQLNDLAPGNPLVGDGVR